MERRIQAHRAALAAREDAAGLELAQAFATIADQVEQELQELTVTITAAGDAASPSWLYRQAQYKRLMAGALAASRAYGHQAAQAIEGQYQAALAYGLRDAAALLRLGGLEPPSLPQRAQDGLLAGMRKRLRRLKLPTALMQLATRAISGGLVTALRLRPAGEMIKPVGLVKKIREGLGAILVNVLRAQRTESTTAYRSVVRAQFAATARVTGWQWAAELEQPKAPCAVCVAMHGQVFSIKTPFGTHPGCRCLAIPVIDGVGPAISTLGEAWLAQQDEARQLAILGKAKRRLYLAGDLQLAQLVEVTEHPVYGMSRHERSLRSMRG